MSIQKSDDFISDVEGQFHWHPVNADWEIAERYLAAVESSCQLLALHPSIGPRVGSLDYLSHPRRNIEG